MGKHREILQVQAHVIERFVTPTNNPPGKEIVGSADLIFI